MQTTLEILKIIVLASILFVWVIRYENIITEFKFFQYPNWLRDLVGILKISFAIMLHNDQIVVIKVGALGIAVLMVAALVTHLKVKNPLPKMLPSMSLLLISLFICLNS